jgi:predicted PurR-regulated permease PerM
LERARLILSQLNKELSGEHKPSEPAQPTDLGSNEQTLIPVEVHEPPGSPLATVAALINPLLGPLATTTLIVVFVIFMLIQQQDLRDRLIRLVGSTDIAHTTAALDDGARRLSRFFLTQLSINAGFGTAIGLGLWAIGIPSAFVWGVLAGILRFVPFVGPVLGLIFPLALALSVGSGWSMALWTIGLFLALEGVTGQAIEPIFHSRHAPDCRSGRARTPCRSAQILRGSAWRRTGAFGLGDLLSSHALQRPARGRRAREGLHGRALAVALLRSGCASGAGARA